MVGNFGKAFNQEGFIKGKLKLKGRVLLLEVKGWFKATGLKRGLLRRKAWGGLEERKGWDGEFEGFHQGW